MVDTNKSTKNIYLAKCLLDCIEDEDLRNIETLLVEKNADPNVIIPDEGGSAFHLLVSEDKNEDFISKAIQLFLKNGANPNVRSETGLTPVHVAAGTGKIRILQLLIVHNADLLAKDDHGKMPIDYALEEEKWDVVAAIEKFNVLRQNGVNLKSFFKDEHSIVQSEDNTNGLQCEKPLPCPSTDPIVITNDTSLPKTDQIDLNQKLIPNSDFNLIVTSDNTSRNETCFESCNSTVTDIETKTNDENGIIFLINSEISSLLSDDTISNLQSGIDDSVLDLDREKSLISPILPPFADQTPKNITCLKPNYITPNNHLSQFLSENFKTFSSTVSELFNTNTSNCSFLSPIESNPNQNKMVFAVTEEYNHVDNEEGIKLVERRHLVKPFELPVDESGVSPLISDDSNEMTFALDTDYDTDTLRSNLTTMGYKPGPITKTTKKVYLKKLVDLWKSCEIIIPTKIDKVYTLELEKTFKNPNWISNLDQYIKLEKQIEDHFENTKTKWRGGNTKSSFTYLLLDPRITQNLPLRASFLKPSDLWRTFIDSIFYVGKGKRARPYAHLYEAVSIWNRPDTANLKSSNKKIQHILNIWKEKYGVICLHIFQNILPVEAHTREAAMIEVLGLNNLKNIKSGEYYGVTMKWRKKDKCMLGVYLLYKALQIFLNEGERQLRPADID